MFIEIRIWIKVGEKNKIEIWIMEIDQKENSHRFENELRNHFQHWSTGFVILTQITLHIFGSNSKKNKAYVFVYIELP